MDVSDFGENDFTERDFGEEDLAALAAALGLSYEIRYDVPIFYGENKSYTVQAWVKMKGLKSKRYAAVSFSGNRHVKRMQVAISLMYGKQENFEALPPRDVKRIRDEAAAFAVKNILSGCAVKVSETRRVVVPKSSSVEELRLRLAAAGGRA